MKKYSVFFPALFLTLSTMPFDVFALTVSGTVVDTKGEALIGATVKDSNTKKAVITDINGNFTLNSENKSNLEISYIGYKTQTVTPQEKLNITLVEDSKILGEVVETGKADITGKECVTKEQAIQAAEEEARKQHTKSEEIQEAIRENSRRPAYLVDEHAKKEAKGKYKKVDGKWWICVPNECIQDYELKNEGCVRKQCTSKEKNDLNAKKAEYKGGKCVPVECKDKYHLNTETNKCEENKCPTDEEDWIDGKCVKVRCTTDELNEIHTSQKYAKWDENQKKCIATECPDKKNFKLSDGKCITNDCPAKELEKINATTGYMQDGKCIPETCIKDYEIDPNTHACTNKKALEEKQKAYDKAHETEQSFENRTLTAVTTAATGIGGMQLMQGLAEQSSDKDATADMAAYIETMRCTYGEGKQVKAGPEEIELPGANDTELMKLRSEYLALAADLKERKEALGMKPGIESETILDRSATGLYDDENVGITSGNYASLYRAQALNSESDQAKIDDASKTSSNRVKYGAIAAGAGVVGGIVGNSLINGKLGEMLKSNKSSTQGKSLKAAAKTEHEALKDLQKCLKDAGVKDTDKLEFTKFYPSVLSVKNIKCKTEITKIANNDAKNVSATTIFADSNDAATIYNKLKESFGATITGKMIGVTLNSDPTDTQNSTAINTLKTALEKVEKRFQDAAKEDEKGFSASDLKDSGVDYSSFMSSLQGDDKSSSIMGLVNGSI